MNKNLVTYFGKNLACYDIFSKMYRLNPIFIFLDMPEFGIENGIFATLPLQIGTGVNPGINYYLFTYFTLTNMYCNSIISQTFTVFLLTVLHLLL